MTKYKINERVKIKLSPTGCYSGIVIGIKINYTVKQDDGKNFELAEHQLEKRK